MKAVGKALLAPLIIFWNPFCEHDKKSKNERKGSVLVQPLEAAFVFLSSLAVTTLTAKFVESRVIKENKNIKMTADKILARLYNIPDKHGEGCLKILKDRISTIAAIMMILPVGFVVNLLSPKLVNRLAPEEKKQEIKSGGFEVIL